MSLTPYRRALARARPTAKASKPGQGLSAPVVLSLIAAAAVVGGALVTAIEADRAASRAFDAKMVEIGVGILATDPGKSDVVPAREWAIHLVEQHSGQTFTDEDHAKLLHSPIVACDPKTTGSLDFSNPCNSMYAPAL